MHSNHYVRVYAGFFVRLAAYTADMFIMFMALLALRVTRLLLMISAPDSFPVKALFFSYSPLDLTIIFITALYFVFCTYFGGATVGKRLFRIKVVSRYKRKPSFWEILYRETVGRFLSSILDLGYIVLAVDSRKRGFHDMLADTRVIYVHCEDAYDYYRDINESPGQDYSTPVDEKSAGIMNRMSYRDYPEAGETSADIHTRRTEEAHASGRIYATDTAVDPDNSGTPAENSVNSSGAGFEPKSGSFGKSNEQKSGSFDAGEEKEPGESGKERQQNNAAEAYLPGAEEQSKRDYGVYPGKDPGIYSGKGSGEDPGKYFGKDTEIFPRKDLANYQERYTGKDPADARMFNSSYFEMDPDDREYKNSSAPDSYKESSKKQDIDASGKEDS